MNFRRVLEVTAALAFCVSFSGWAQAGPVDVLVGDKDGFGTVGCPDNGICVWPGPGPSGTNYDGRSAAEMAAVNGAQITDIYSAVFPGFGPNPTMVADVLLPFAGQLIAATLTIAMGDFQATTFGPIAANINGVAVSLAFEDGFQVTTTRDFVLNAAQLAAVNLTGVVDLHLDHTGSNDFIAFDWFELTGTNNINIPEPTSLAILGAGLGALLLAGRRKAAPRS